MLLSHGLWERRFGSDPGVVGRSLTINDEPVTVAGVLPATFDMAAVFAPGSHFDLYFPFPLSNETNRWGNTMAIIGRLKPGVSIGSAQAELKILAQQITQAHPERNDFEGRISPLAEHVSGRIRPALLVLACAVGVVMLIVCANLSNLLLARTATRQKEIAIRTALGAGRRRLIRQMLTEGVTLSCCGAVLGVIVAAVGTHLLARIESLSIPLLSNIHTDVTVLGFCLLAAVLTGVVFGLAPALQVPSHTLHDALKDTARGSTAGKGRNWVRGALVVSEIAFACVLLVSAGLLVRSFLRVLDVNLGFRPEQASTVRVDPDARYTTQAQQNAYFDEVLRRVREIPGVVAAGITDALPLGRNRTWGAGAKGQVYPRGQFPTAFVRIVSDGYLRSLGISLVSGRDISPTDTPTTEPVIVINQSMARALWPGQNAIGQLMRACGERRVVGVVGDVRHLALEQTSGNEMYLPDAAVPRYVLGGPGGPEFPAPGRAHRRRARRTQTDRAESSRKRASHLAADRGQVGFAEALCGTAAGWIRALRAGVGIARNLRRDFLWSEPANAGDRDSHGAGRFGIQASSRDYRTDPVARGGGYSDRRRGIVGAGTGDGRNALRSNGERSADVSPDARCADAGRSDCRLSSSAPGFADRSFDRATSELNYSCRRATIGSIRDAFHAGA